jgi:hypothetical protein
MFVGFCSGVLSPFIMEKLKGKKEEKRKLTSIEQDISVLQNAFQDFSSRLAPLEEKVRALEINLSHNTGVLKGQNPDIPLEDTTTSAQASFAPMGSSKES